MIVIYILGGIVLVGAIAVVIVSLRRNGQDDDSDPLQARLAEFIQRGDVSSLEEIELSQPFSERVLIPIIRKVGEFSVRFTPQKAIQNVTRMMELAGNPWPIDGATFFALRFVLAIVFGGLAILYLVISPPADSSKNLLYIAGAAFVGSYIPASMLTSKITARQTEVRKAMPDALDLLTICVEAGLGFEAAMSKVAEKWDNELSLAFARTLREIQLGKVRRDSLKDMADRLGIAEMTSFVAAIIQSEQLGVSMAKVLRIQADQMRMKRRQFAEEQAHKAPIKMIIPMALLIFPSIMIIILVPAVMQIMSNLGGSGI
jgi:tight adherence protein C